jgi:hypothetical protein
LFNITDAQLLNLHNTIDKKFELVVTDNVETDEIFKSRKAGKVLDLGASANQALIQTN